MAGGKSKRKFVIVGDGEKRGWDLRKGSFPGHSGGGREKTAPARPQGGGARAPRSAGSAGNQPAMAGGRWARLSDFARASRLPDAKTFARQQGSLPGSARCPDPPSVNNPGASVKLNGKALFKGLKRTAILETLPGNTRSVPKKKKC